jgi:succinoglycan biosynthesis protein ExoM
MNPMSAASPLISVCLCTYKRSPALAACLASILRQTTTEAFEVIVTDNDSGRSGEGIGSDYAKLCEARHIRFTYVVEPVQNIALARNRGLRAARGSLIAFIDDDECASPHWLACLYRTLVESGADGVFGPVIPDIPDYFPLWMRRSGLFDRPLLEEGASMAGRTMRTGNALIKRELLGLREGPFDPLLGRIGGSDSDLFAWLRHRGFKFVWSARAELTETVEEKRRYIRWHLVRAYRGGWGYSKRFVDRRGRVAGLLMLARVIPSSLKALLQAAARLRNIRYAGMIVLTNLVTNAGKIGYFLGAKVEEYKA